MNKWFIASTALAVLACAPIVTKAQLDKPYEKVEITSTKENSYTLTFTDITGPFVILNPSGGGMLTKMNSTYQFSVVDAYPGNDTYIRIVSPDQSVIYDTIYINTAKNQFIYDFDASSYELPTNQYAFDIENVAFNEGSYTIHLSNIRMPFAYSNSYGLKDSIQPGEHAEITVDLPNAQDIISMYHETTQASYAQFTIDMVNRIYSVEQIPAISIGYPTEIVDINRDTSLAEMEQDAKLPYRKWHVSDIAQSKGFQFNDKKSTFTDIKGNTHEQNIKLLHQLGVINGYTDGTFQPNKKLRQTDIIKLVGRYLELDVQQAATAQEMKKYGTKDVELISYLKKLAPIFTPINYSKEITRGEFAKYLVAILEYQLKQQNKTVDLATFVKNNGHTTQLKLENPTYQQAVSVLEYFNITTGSNGHFNDQDTLSRGQFASFLTRTYNIKYNKIN